MEEQCAQGRVAGGGGGEGEGAGVAAAVSSEGESAQGAVGGKRGGERDDRGLREGVVAHIEVFQARLHGVPVGSGGAARRRRVERSHDGAAVERSGGDVSVAERRGMVSVGFGGRGPDEGGGEGMREGSGGIIAYAISGEIELAEGGVSVGRGDGVCDGSGTLCAEGHVGDGEGA